MLVTQQPQLRNFWYPVCRVGDLESGPLRFVLLGSPLVLWRDGLGNVFALADRCCHRTARLSQGRVIEGSLQCPYHGWQFDGGGCCVRVPQISGRIPESYRVPAYAATTPIDDATSQVIQFCLSNDTEAEVPEADITAWEQAIAAEDRGILETTDYDTPLDLDQEQHMASDKPGILMRRQLARLFSQSC